MIQYSSILMTNNHYQNFKTGQPEDHKFQWTQVLYWTSPSDDTSVEKEFKQLTK